jgi:hypothetical protein
VEGRDITTVVAPDAPVRILLTAAPEVRAARRSAELSGEDADAVAAALHRRDAADSTVVDFLTAADGVTVVDSTDLDFAQTVEAVLDVISATDPTHRRTTMAAEDEYEAGPDQIEEKLANLDEELAEQRAARCAPRSPTTTWTMRTTTCSRASPPAARSSRCCPRCPSSRSSDGRTSASRRS